MARRASPTGVRRRPAPPVGAERLFGPRERTLVRRLLPRVEALVGEHFHITSFGPIRRTYEVETLGDGAEHSRAPRALAKLLRFDRAERPLAGGPRVTRYYRIYLQDDNLLARAEAEAPAGVTLEALLTCVLAHELIHVVRFESFEVHYRAGGPARHQEETRVHGLTRAVLAPLKDRAIDRVLEGLSLGGVDVVE